MAYGRWVETLRAARRGVIRKHLRQPLELVLVAGIVRMIFEILMHS